jgi:ABC-2 type transport system permease protein
MPRILLAILGNTFTETLRQPIYGIVIAATTLVLIFCPSLAMFSMDDDNQLLVDIGLSTLLLAGVLLGAFASSTVVTEEIENKTALTVLSKTVSRTIFILGKFLGVAAAVILAEYFLSLVFLIIVRHGVLQTASDQSDAVVITFGVLAASITFIIGLAGNYFYRWRFSSTAIICGTLLVSLALGLMVFIDPEWSFNPTDNHIKWEIRPLSLTLIAVLILTAVAVMSATRFNMIMTLIICMVVFILGVTFEQWLGPVARDPDQALFIRFLAKIPLAIIPCISFYTVTNAIYHDAVIPTSYIVQVAFYAFLYVSACVMFAIAMFRSREIG